MNPKLVQQNTPVNVLNINKMLPESVDKKYSFNIRFLVLGFGM